DPSPAPALLARYHRRSSLHLLLLCVQLRSSQNASYGSRNSRLRPEVLQNSHRCVLFGVAGRIIHRLRVSGVFLGRGSSRAQRNLVYRRLCQAPGRAAALDSDAAVFQEDCFESPLLAASFVIVWGASSTSPYLGDIAVCSDLEKR